MNSRNLGLTSKQFPFPLVLLQGRDGRAGGEALEGDDEPDPGAEGAVHRGGAAGGVPRGGVGLPGDAAAARAARLRQAGDLHRPGRLRRGRPARHQHRPGGPEDLHRPRQAARRGLHDRRRKGETETGLLADYRTPRLQ